MGLADSYSQRMWSPNEEIDQRLGSGMGQLGAAVDAHREREQNSYSNPFKQALEHLMENPDADPVMLARQLKGGSAGGGNPADATPVQPASGPQGVPQSAFPANGGMGPVAMGRAMPAQPDGGFASNMPQPTSMNRDIATLGNNPQLAPMAYHGDESGMARPPPTQTNQVFAPPPPRTPGYGEQALGFLKQAGGAVRDAFAPAPERTINTNADVRGALSLLPYTQVKKDTLVRANRPGRDYLGEIKARGEEARKTEGVRQEGRVSLMDMRNKERQLEVAIKDAFDRDSLDERSAHHLQQIQLGYAALRSKEHLLDKTIDYKMTTQDDDDLKTARTVVDSLTASRGALVGSAFASTPEGQKTLVGLDHTLGIWSARLNEYAQRPISPPGSTRTVERKETRGGATTDKPQGPGPVPQPPRGPTGGPPPKPGPGAKPPFQQRVQQLKAQGMSKEQALQTLRSEGYSEVK